MERKNGGTRWSEISAHDFFFFFSIDALMRAYRFNEPRKKVKSFGSRACKLSQRRITRNRVQHYETRARRIELRAARGRASLNFRASINDQLAGMVTLSIERSKYNSSFTGTRPSRPSHPFEYVIIDHGPLFINELV